jgi:KDO2-lipid IV(A) lauroyltransferase
VREGGRWSGPQRAKNLVLYGLASSVLAVTSRLPSAVLAGVGRGVGLFVWAVTPRLRRLAAANVARALPEIAPAARTAFVRRVYVRLGALLGETVAALDPRRPLDPLPLLPGARACLDEAVAEGRGVVFASAHLGPWERVAASLVAAGVPLSVVAREPYDARFQRLYDRLRAGRGVRAIYRGRAGSGRTMVRVLRAGGVLAVPMDLASRVPSVEVPFLDVPAPTPVGPARLALRTGAAIVVGTVAPNHDGLGITFKRLQVSGADERELSARINEELSARIRALPEAWPWMHDRWPVRAPHRAS